MRRIRHKWRWLFYLLAPLRLPEYLLWRLELGQLWIDDRVARTDWARGPLAPVFGLVRFVRYWWISRPFKKLLIALPVVLGLVALLTLYFINLNRSRGGAEEAYYMQAQEALGSGNYQKADFLFTKILQYRRYEDNPQAMHSAMIAAYANGNTMRFGAIKQKLVSEMNYEPAKGWYVSMMLERPMAMDAQVRTELLGLCTRMVDEAGEASWAAEWRVRLAKLYRILGRGDEALELLQAVESPTVEERSLTNNLLLESGQRSGAREAVEAGLAQIEREDPAFDRYLQLWVEAKLMQAVLEQDPAKAVRRLQEALAEVGSQRNKPDAQLPQLDTWQSVLHIKMLIEYSKIEGSDDLVYRSANQAVSGTRMSYLIGSVIHDLSDKYSELSLRLEDLDVAVAQYGGGVAHLAFGLRLWDADKLEEARRHFQVAQSVLPPGNLADALHMVTMARAEKVRASQNQDGFFAGGDNPMVPIHRLLEEQALLEPDREATVSMDRGRLYISEGNWGAVVALLEPRVADWEPQQAAAGYRMLIEATQQMSDMAKIEEFTGKRDEIVNRLR